LNCTQAAGVNRLIPTMHAGNATPIKTNPWRQAATRWARTGADLLYPPACTLCGELIDDAADTIPICPACRPGLCDAATACARCGQPVPSTHGVALSCPACARQPPRFDAAVRLGRYEGTLREAVLRTKLRAEEPLTLALARLLIAERRPQLEACQPTVVVPIPMHWTRRLWRGVNGAEIIARLLAAQLAVPLRTKLLRRVRRTDPQADLTPWQRKRNVRRAFQTGKGQALAGARVLLIDDIMTTGATANEATRILRRQGAAFVTVAVIARAVER
jgi:ComF family protein